MKKLWTSCEKLDNRRFVRVRRARQQLYWLCRRLRPSSSSEGIKCLGRELVQCGARILFQLQVRRTKMPSDVGYGSSYEFNM
jgi:hypothetical protein